MEHGPLDLAGLGQYCGAWLPCVRRRRRFWWSCRSRPKRRLGTRQCLADTQLLTLGVHGFLLCHANSRMPCRQSCKPCATRSSAAAAVPAAKTPPRQSGASRRPNICNSPIHAAESVRRTAVGLKVENKRALANAELTTATPGVAFAEWGPADMSMSHGFYDVPIDLERPRIAGGAVARFRCLQGGGHRLPGRLHGGQSGCEARPRSPYEPRYQAAQGVGRIAPARVPVTELGQTRRGTR